MSQEMSHLHFVLASPGWPVLEQATSGGRHYVSFQGSEESFYNVILIVFLSVLQDKEYSSSGKNLVRKKRNLKYVKIWTVK